MTIYRKAVYPTDSFSNLIKPSTEDLNASIHWNDFHEWNEFCHRNTQGILNVHFNHIHLLQYTPVAHLEQFSATGVARTGA